MKGLSPKQRNELEARACKPGTVFSSCSRFARPAFRDPLLALHALLSNIVEIPYTVSDPGVAKIKIAWWKNELLDNPVQSQHPFVRALLDLEILDKLNRDMLWRFFDGVFDLAEGEAFEDTDALMKIARYIGGSEAQLEAGTGGHAGDDLALDAIGSAGFITDLLEDLDRQYCNENWWMPMNLRARYGITGLSGEDQNGLNEAVQWMAGLAVRELTQGVKSLPGNVNKGRAADGLQFIKVRAGVLHRRLKKLQKNPSSHKEYPSGPGEILYAWWLAVKST